MEDRNLKCYALQLYRGLSSKIESLLVRAYLKRRYSLPKPDVGYQTTGGYTDIFYTGDVNSILG